MSDALDPEISAIIAGELRTGEQLAWTGRPLMRWSTGPADLVLVPVGLFYLGFGIVWMATAASLSRDTTGGTFALFGLPIVAVGLYLSVGRFFVVRSRRRRTVYAMTDRRALAVVIGRTRRAKTTDLGSVTSTEKRVRGDGSGTLAFGDTTWWQLAQESSGAGAFIAMSFWRAKGARPLLFLDIPDVDRVDRLAQRLIDALRGEQRA